MVVPWANGRGTTAVIACWPAADEWIWRLSLADVVTDAPFSSLPGVDRWIAVARGHGMELHLGASGSYESTVLDDTHGAVAFSGDDEVWCRVLDGPLVDVNLMVRRGAATGGLDIHELGPDEVVTVDAIAAVVLSGELVLSEEVTLSADACASTVDAQESSALTAFDAVVTGDGASIPIRLRSTGSARLAVAFATLT